MKTQKIIEIETQEFYSLKKINTSFAAGFLNAEEVIYARSRRFKAAVNLA